MPSHSLAHRRAVAAILRRDPQTGFSPTIFPALPDITAIFPNLPLPGRPDRPDRPGPGGPNGPGGDNDDDDDSTSSTATPSSTIPALSLPGQSSTDQSSSSSSVASSTEPTSTPTLATSTTAVAPRPASPTTPTGSVVVVTGQTSTAVVTRSSPTLSSTPSASTSIANSNDSTEGISTGAVVGGIGAGIVAIAVVGFAAAYFVRRAKRKTDGDDQFDPSTFRRSAVLLNDPRPPSMIENRGGGNANPPATFGAHANYQQSEYGYADNSNGNNHAGYGATGAFQSFAPGQVVGPAAYAHPSQAQPSPFTPPSQYGYYNETEYYSQAQPMNHASPGMGMVASYPVLTRQPSDGTQYGYAQQGVVYGQGGQMRGQGGEGYAQGGEGYGQGAQMYDQQGRPYDSRGQGHDLLPPEPLPQGDYVDLNRSSVSPYQAQQYEEISRRLNTEVPMGQGQGQYGEQAQGQAQQETDRDLPPVPTKDIADPFASAPPSPAMKTFAPATRDMDMEFPVPPASPVNSVSRYEGGQGQRVESMPPVLNLNLENRPMSFGVVGAGTGTGTGVGAAAGAGAGAVGAGTGTGVVNGGAGAKSSPLAQPPQQVGGEQQSGDAKKRAVSVYDPEDAYGGF